MKTTYKIKVTFKDGKYKYLFASKDKLIKNKNVLNYIFGRFDKNQVTEIKTRCGNSMTGKFYWQLNYNPFFETAKDYNLRVEAINAPGYEDLTGYGSRTNGIINRFYIGRSTGWVPIYLEILTNRSSGGSALFTHKRKFSHV